MAKTSAENAVYMREYRMRRLAEGRPLAKKTQEQVFASGLWKNYRIRIPEYTALREAQGNKCKICETEFLDSNIQSSSKRNCVVDHDHSTGKVRGLLCPTCNLGLGQFQDSPALLSAAATYLSLNNDPLAIR